MVKPVITTRAGKGSALTWTEGDTNLTNLRDATITVSDGTNSKAIDLNGTITFVAGSNVTLGVNSSTGAVTINSGATASSSLNYAQEGGGTRVTITTGATFPAAIVSVSITTTGGPVLINAYGDAENSGPGYWGKLQLYRGTTALGAIVHHEGSAGSENSPFSLNYIDNPSAGTYTYYLKANSISGGDINYGESTAPTINVTELQGIQGPTGATGASGATNLDGLTDVVITTPAAGHVLLHNGTNFVNQLASQYLTAAYVGGMSSTTNTDYYLLGNGLNSSSVYPVYNSALTMNPSTGTLKATTYTGGLKGYNEGAIYDLGTTGGTIAPNVANGNVQKITLNSALTINAFTSPVAGQSLTLIIYGGTSYTSITSTMKFAGGVKTLTGTAGCIDILSIYYDGTNYFASLNKGFA